MSRARALAALIAVVALVAGCSTNRHRIPTPGPHGAGPTLTPPANVFLRTGMDDDPSSYLGRFVPDTATPADIDEAAALQLPCSKHYRIKKVGGGGIEYDELFRASRAASVQFGIPQTPVSVGASHGEESVVRIKYKLLHKWIAELADPAGFEACCKQAADQCTGRVVGEFLGGTGAVYYAEGSESDLGVQAPGIGSLEVKDGVVWRRGIAFEQPVFFAFKLTGSIVTPQGVAAGDDWDRVVPRSTQGTYFVGTSDYLESERVARDEALLDARRQVVRWLGEAIQQGSVRVESLSGRAGKLEAALADEGAVQRASGAVVRFLKDEQWKAERATMPDGMRFQAKVLAFLPKASVEGAAAAALDALDGGAGGAARRRKRPSACAVGGLLVLLTRVQPRAASPPSPPSSRSWHVRRRAATESRRRRPTKWSPRQRRQHTRSQEATWTVPRATSGASCPARRLRRPRRPLPPRTPAATGARSPSRRRAPGSSVAATRTGGGARPAARRRAEPPRRTRASAWSPRSPQRSPPWSWRSSRPTST